MPSRSTMSPRAGKRGNARKSSASAASPWPAKMAQKKDAKVVMLDSDFAGIKKGASLLVATPEIFADYVRKVPFGETRRIERVRNELARKHKADATCPVTTSIFLRIVAEAAWDEIQSGKALADVAPFWRVIDPDSPLAKKLRAGTQWLRDVRAAEQPT